MYTSGDGIPGYKIIENIEETRDYIVFRCKKENENEILLIKLIKAENPTVTEIARFKQEYEKIKNGDFRGIINVQDIIDKNEIIAVVIDDFNGITLKEALNKGKFEIKRFLQIAVQLSETLGYLHGSDITHKNIKPGSVLIKKDFSEARLMDFGVSTILTRSFEDVYNSEVIADTFYYISPEQTGRMNRTVDYRTDLYSLGVVFYEMLTGAPPFISNDPMEIFHSHIAKSPMAPSSLDPGIPGVISDIVLKLMSKAGEERYQNSFGLMSDLQNCLDQLNRIGKIERFKIGERDVPIKYIEPQDLYGREREIQILLDSFGRAAAGKREAVFISGPPGIGKTVLINETHRAIVEKRGYFISGKYDQLTRDVPYLGILEAFERLARQILAESEDRIEMWRGKLLDALGPNGRIITDIIPDFKLIIGEQPELPDVGPEELRNRFNLFFERFVSVFSGKEHPVVMFLDDLQWADLASLELLKNIILNQSIGHLLIIGTFRDNEVDESHPLFSAIETIEASNVLLRKLRLPPLTVIAIKKIILNSLRCTGNEGEVLSEIILKKTGGNPFFINQFLRTLYHEKLLELDPVKGWHWEINKIKNVRSSDNVVEFMIRKIGILNMEELFVLKVAACIGNKFDLELIASITGMPVESILNNLLRALEERLIIVSGNDYKFFHEKIQEAVYTLITDEEKPELHLKIGKAILKMTEEKDLLNKIYFLVNQMNFGIGLVGSPDERKKLSRLNLMAGEKAKGSIAYASAINYFRIAMDLLPESCWADNYRLAYSIYFQCAECEYLMGNFDEAKSLFDSVIDNAKSNIDRANVYNSLILLFTSIGEIEKAVDTGIYALKMFGVRIPIEPAKSTIAWNLLKLKFILFKKDIKDIINLRMMKEPEKLVIANLLTSLGTPAFYMNNKLFALIVLITVVEYYFKYGNSHTAPPAYVSLGTIIGSALGDFSSAYQFGELALKLNEEYGINKNSCQLNFLFAYFIQHWKKHARNDIKYFKRGFRYGLESGDIIYSGHCINIMALYRFIIGDNINVIFEEYRIFEAFLRSTKDPFIINNYVDNIKMLNRFRQTPGHHNDFNNESAKRAERLNEIRSNGNSIELCNYLHNCIKISFLFGNYSESLMYASELERLEIPPGTLFIVEHYFYYSLILIRLYRDVSFHEKRKYLRILKRNQKRLLRVARHSPENFQHKYDLVQANRAALKGKRGKAIDFFKKGIAGAKDNGYLNMEALANELFTKFYISNGETEKAKMYMEKACDCYLRWGAHAKLNQLEKVHPELLTKGGVAKPINNLLKPATGELLDTATIIKASQAISNEIELDRLLYRLYKIIMENAGANRVVILLNRGGNLYIEAQYDIDCNSPAVVQSIPVDESGAVPSNIIRYTARTLEPVVIENALTDDIYSKEKYILKNRPKSLLSLPVIHKEKLTAILYLENTLNAGVFTPERQEILNLLAGQAAISLENAFLYEDLKKEIELRKRAEREQAELERKILDVNEEERRKIGIELHDGLGHILLDISMKSGLLAEKLGEINIPEKKDAEEIERYTKEAIKKNRSLAEGLFPVNLSNVSFVEIINEFKKELDLNHSIFCEVDIDEKADVEKMKMSTHLYFIIQEAVRNIIKHSNASRAWIKLYMEEGLFVISVQDNGRGIVENNKRHHGMGISIMQYRAKMIGAQLEIKAVENGGTEVNCRLKRDGVFES